MDLTAAEARVLGCLIERAALDSDSYPVTLNTLRLACNRTEGRNPVVAYDDRTVEDTLLALKSKGLARFVDPLRGERATRYSHRADDRWRLGPAELAVLSVLLVGGPMTLVDVEARARRLHPFGHQDEIVAVLDTLAARTPTPFAARVGGGSRPAETRWVQALAPVSVAGVDDDDEAAEPRPAGAGTRAPAVLAEPTLVPSYSELAARVAELERRLAVASQRPTVLGGGDWRSVHAVPIAESHDDRNGLARPRWDDAAGAGHGERSLPAGDPGADVPSLGALAERLAALERRLARVEAELGALR